MTDPALSGLPTAERRKAVLVLADRDYQLARRDLQFAALRDDPELAVVVADGRDGDSALGNLLRSQGHLVAGRVLVQSVRDTDVYVEPQSAVEDSAIERCFVVAQVAQMLGATLVEYDEVKVETDTTAFDAKGSLKVKVVEAAAEAQRETRNRVAATVRTRNVFPGGEPDPLAARDLLAEHGLTHDPRLSGLVAMRSGSNPLQRHELWITSSKEVTRNLRVAARAAVGLKFASGGADADVRFQAESSLSVEVHVSIDFT